MADPRFFLYIALGILLLAFVALDVIWTIMGEGGGPFTRRFTSFLWKGMVKLHTSSRGTAVLSVGGIVIVLLATALWLAGLWTGWTLIFNADPLAVLDYQTDIPADLSERIYFTGMTIFTLGTGDFVAGGQPWQFLMALASLSGFSLLTGSITYLVPVVQAAAQKRQVAVHIASLGMTSEEILAHTWNGSRFPALENHLQSLNAAIAEIRQNHLTYPVLHYFHSSSDVAASPLRIAAIDEALTIIGCAMRDWEECFDRGTLLSTRQVITEFLDTLSKAYIQPKDEAPPPPDLTPLRELGLPLINDDEEIARRFAELDERRRLLLGLVTSDGWNWDDLRPRWIQSRGLTPLKQRD